MTSRFVRPEVRTLALANGDRLVVRARLSAGELRAKLNRMYTAVGEDGRLQVNRLQVGLAQVTAYLVDWNLTDGDGRPVAIATLSIEQLEQVVNQLSPEAFNEIFETIDAHETAMKAEREAEKKTATGVTAFGSTSPSLAAVGGATSGSAT